VKGGWWRQRRKEEEEGTFPAKMRKTNEDGGA
jgi:hypothetical protein